MENTEKSPCSHLIFIGHLPCAQYWGCRDGNYNLCPPTAKSLEKRETDEEATSAYYDQWSEECD